MRKVLLLLFSLGNIFYLSAQTRTLESSNAFKSTYQSGKLKTLQRPASSLSAQELDCRRFQFGYAQGGPETLIDVVVSDGTLYTAGHIKSGNNTDISVSSLTATGKELWSVKVGGAGAEYVRKITASGDGGILLTGQTYTYASSGGIFCAKIDKNGTVIWQRHFSLGSPNGDLGMEIIPTQDGGYAVNAIIDVAGTVADMVVIKLDGNANISWCKRFDSGDGEDGVGLVQDGNELLVTADIQQGLGHYKFAITRLNIATGAVVGAKVYVPQVSGLFNPYLFKKPDHSGYYISGHTINNSSYATMRHTVLSLNSALDVQRVQSIEINPQANNFYTGFVPLPDGSFIGCASPQSGSGGYTYRIGADDKVQYAIQFEGASVLNPNRLTVSGTNAVIAGSGIDHMQQTGFLAALPLDGNTDNMCNVHTVNASVSNPFFDTDNWVWPTTSTPEFKNIEVNLPSQKYTPAVIDLCPLVPDFDFTATPDLCDPLEVTFSTALPQTRSFEWDLGNGTMESGKQVVTTRYTGGQPYTAKLTVTTQEGCTSTLEKQISFPLLYKKGTVLGRDTTICAGDSLILTAKTAEAFCWGGVSMAQKTRVVRPTQQSTYSITVVHRGSNLLRNADMDLGNSGFVSEMVQAPQPAAGTFTIAQRGTEWRSNLPACPDHSQASGKMMVVTSGTSGKTVWSQQVTVAPQTNYLLEAWIQTLSRTASSDLVFLVDGNQVGTTFSSPANTCNWVPQKVYWNSGSKKEITLALIDRGTAAGEHIYALDDIYMGVMELHTDSIAVDISKPVAVSIQDTAKFCPQQPVQINAATSEAGSTIVWSGAPDIDVSNPWQPKVITDAPTRLYATITSVWGCTQKDSVLLLPGTVPVAKIVSDSTVCVGTVHTLRADVSNVNNMQWMPANLVSDPDAFSPVTTVQRDAWYHVAVQSKDGCTAQDSLLIRAINLPQVLATNDTTVCKGSALQLSATGGVRYEWAPGASISDIYSDVPLATPLANTQYIVTVTNGDGCVAHDTVNVQVTETAAFKLVAGSSEVCVGDSTVLTASGGTQYTWLTDGFESENGARQIFPNAGANTYQVVIADRVCAVTDTLSVTVLGNALPQGGIEPHGVVNCSEPSLQLQARGGVRYEWLGAQGITQLNVANPVVTPTANTTYKVKIFSAEGCASEHSTTVEVTFSGNRSYLLPNAFTPNSDGLNDCFGTKQWGVVENYSLIVFNRWGQAVFQTNNPSDCWNGTYKGVAQPAGVYVYLVKGKAACGVVDQKGTLMLVR